MKAVYWHSLDFFVYVAKKHTSTNIGHVWWFLRVFNKYILQESQQKDIMLTAHRQRDYGRVQGGKKNNGRVIYEMQEALTELIRRPIFQSEALVSTDHRITAGVCHYTLMRLYYRQT